jgi:DNA ligase-1
VTAKKERRRRPAAGGSLSFVRFGQAADRIGATTKRLEKAAILNELFASLSDDDLALAARYFAGHVFPLRDQRTTNVGGAALVAAVAAARDREKDDVRARLVRLGDFGDVAFEIFSETSARARGAMTLEAVASLLERLSETSGSKRKLELLVATLQEASPLEGKYLVKLLASDLRIGLREGSVEDAVARLVGVPVGEVQWANMLVGDVGETAVLARRGELGSAEMRLFHPIKFMLATPATDLSDVAKQMAGAFFVEDKYDGIRAQAHVAVADPAASRIHGELHDGVRVALFSRTLDEITPSYPDLVAPLAALVQTPIARAGLLLDGEILPVRGGETLPFQELQKRLGRKTLTEDILAEVPVVFVAYDALYADGRLLVAEPFASRRVALEALDVDGERVRVAPSTETTEIEALDDEFERARARGNEGLMVKDPASTYKPGRRGREWLKIKRALATLDVVVTAVEVGNGRRSHLLSDYTFAVRASESDATLLNVGKAYSGLTDAELGELSDWFRAHTIQEFAHGRVRTVEPEIVLEVTFDNVQVSKRHKGGFALRFPRILRIRGDKPVSEIDTIETVRRLAEGGYGDDP